MILQGEEASEYNKITEIKKNIKMATYALIFDVKTDSNTKS